MAIVFGRNIYLIGIPAKEFIKDKIWLQHELKHVAQYRQLGFIFFIASYSWESIKNGYHNNKYELEARNAEKKEFPCNKYKLILPKT